MNATSLTLFTSCPQIISWQVRTTFLANNLNVENLKQRVVNLISLKDKGIIGAFMLYQDDRDFEGFKARIIHKILTPTQSRENPAPM